MPKFLDDFEQGTAEWLAVRAGHVTGSRMIDVMGAPKPRATYLRDLVAERLSGDAKRSSGSQSTNWGHAAEELGRQAYENLTGNFVRQVGFALHDTIKFLGVSSDGLTEDAEGKGAIEIKSPFNPGIHIKTWDEGMPDEHIPQTQSNIWVLELDWIDFCSFDPSFPAPLNLYRQRFYPDKKYIAEMEAKTRPFLAEVNVMASRLIQKAKLAHPDFR